MTGLILPKECLGLEQGDNLTLTETPDGFLVSRVDADFETAMKLVDDIMAEYRDTLQTLAK